MLSVSILCSRELLDYFHNNKMYNLTHFYFTFYNIINKNGVIVPKMIDIVGGDRGQNRDGGS